MSNKVMNQVSSLVSKGIREYNSGAYMRAIDLFKKAYRPKDITPEAAASVAFNVATTCMDVYDYSAALQWCNRSLEHADDWNVAYTRSLVQLHLHNRQNGLAEYYTRYKKTAADAVSFPNLPIKFHDDDIGNGEVFSDKRVLILNEQGFGDEIMFLRVCTRLNEVVKHAHVQVYPELFDLVQNTLAFKYPNITFFCDRSLSLEFVNSFDCWSALGSVWAQFTLHCDNLNPVQFDRSDSVHDGIRIGFICSPNKKSKNACARSVDEKIFKNMSRMKEFKDVAFINLQYGTEYTWCENVKIESFYDTYKEMSKVDLVICCDTGAAHLAACMNVNFMLVYTGGYIDWRWNDKTYYPNVEVVAQNKLTDKVCQKILTMKE